MNRRQVLRTVGLACAAAVGGCLGNGDDAPDDGTADGATTGSGNRTAQPDLPRVEDPPAAVYVPTHREGMVMPGPVEVGDLVVGPMVTYPHRFWLVSGDRTTAVEVESTDDVHLMLTAWDAETRTVVPTSNASVTVSRDGERVVPETSLWPMLSQTMGAHFGDNLALDGQGTYEIEVTVPPVGSRTTGALAGRFEESATATVEFTYDDAFMEQTVDAIEWVDEGYWGKPGAIDPVVGNDESNNDRSSDDESGDGMPFSALPSATSLPGVHQGTATSGDAEFVVTVVSPPGRFADGDPYLLVSPRTPYNRVPLPNMSLSAVLTREGERVHERRVVETVDDEAGHHYGTALPDARSGDSLRLVIDGPPQTARHQGYETAFLDMPPVEVGLDGW